MKVHHSPVDAADDGRMHSVIENHHEWRRALTQLPPAPERAAIRERAGASRRDVGRAVGVSSVTVASWEAGQHTPNRQHLRAYLDVLADLTHVANELGAVERREP